MKKLLLVYHKISPFLMTCLLSALWHIDTHVTRELAPRLGVSMNLWWHQFPSSSTGDEFNTSYDWPFGAIIGNLFQFSFPSLECAKDIPFFIWLHLFGITIFMQNINFFLKVLLQVLTWRLSQLTLEEERVGSRVSVDEKCRWVAKKVQGH